METGLKQSKPDLSWYMFCFMFFKKTFHTTLVHFRIVALLLFQNKGKISGRQWSNLPTWQAAQDWKIFWTYLPFVLRWVIQISIWNQICAWRQDQYYQNMFDVRKNGSVWGFHLWKKFIDHSYFPWPLRIMSIHKESIALIDNQCHFVFFCFFKSSRNVDFCHTNKRRRQVWISLIHNFLFILLQDIWHIPIFLDQIHHIATLKIHYSILPCGLTIFANWRLYWWKTNHMECLCNVFGGSFFSSP